MLSNAKTISISGAALKNNKVDVGDHQGPVLQKVNSAIHRINHYPVDNTIGFANTYPLDSDLLGGQYCTAFEQLGTDLDVLNTMQKTPKFSLNQSINMFRGTTEWGH